MRAGIGALAIGAVGLLAAQTDSAPKNEGARDLFFAGAAPKDELPPMRKQPAAAPAPKKSGINTPASALHLGMRYALLLVKSRAGVGEPVDPARIFAKGDCVAINFESNRSGYLYVLAKESGGSWAPLFPTPELADQDNRIDPGRTVRAPSESCFEIDDPPGTETLFVVLSRSPRDIAELAESIRMPKQKNVNAVVAQMESGTRDLPFREVAPAAAPAKAASPVKEPQHAVYVVNGSAKASSTLVTRIEIKHR
jgi:Domain of unknown function (DUF4384)